MKKYIAILAFIISFTSCEKKQNGYIIEGNITGIKDSTKVSLFNLNTYKNIDSTIIVNDRFVFKGELDDPTSVSVGIFDDVDVFVNFWLENKKIEIKTSKEQLLEKDTDFSKIITESELDKIELRHKKLLKPIRDRQVKAYKKLTENLISEEEYKEYRDSSFNASIKFLFENPNNYFSLSEILLRREALKKEKLEAYFSQLTPELKNSSYGKILDNYLHIKPVKEGDYIFDIIGKNLNEEEVKLSDFKGKTILLDFWASWCVPCVKQMKEEFPSIIEKYKDKNFQIVSYSFDHDKKSWKNGNEKLKLSWPDFSNLMKLGNDPTGLRYSIYQIPTSFIISEEGKILKRVEYNDDLEKELDKVLLD